MDLYSSISELKKLINDRSKLNIYRKTYKLNDCISELIPNKVPLTKEHSIQANVVYYSNVFAEVPDNCNVKVKNNEIKSWVLDKNSNLNVIIK